MQLTENSQEKSASIPERMLFLADRVAQLTKEKLPEELNKQLKELSDVMEQYYKGFFEFLSEHKSNVQKNVTDSPTYRGKIVAVSSEMQLMLQDFFTLMREDIGWLNSQLTDLASKGKNHTLETAFQHIKKMRTLTEQAVSKVASTTPGQYTSQVVGKYIPEQTKLTAKSVMNGVDARLQNSDLFKEDWSAVKLWIEQRKVKAKTAPSAVIQYARQTPATVLKLAKGAPGTILNCTKHTGSSIVNCAKQTPQRVWNCASNAEQAVKRFNIDPESVAKFAKDAPGAAVRYVKTRTADLGLVKSDMVHLYHWVISLPIVALFVAWVHKMFAILGLPAKPIPATVPTPPPAFAPSGADAHPTKDGLAPAVKEASTSDPATPPASRAPPPAKVTPTKEAVKQPSLQEPVKPKDDIQPPPPVLDQTIPLAKVLDESVSPKVGLAPAVAASTSDPATPPANNSAPSPAKATPTKQAVKPTDDIPPPPPVVDQTTPAKATPTKEAVKPTDDIPPPPPVVDQTIPLATVLDAKAAHDLSASEDDVQAPDAKPEVTQTEVMMAQVATDLADAFAPLADATSPSVSCEPFSTSAAAPPKGKKAKSKAAKHPTS